MWRLGLLLAMALTGCAGTSTTPVAASPKAAADGFPSGYSECIRSAAIRQPYTDGFLDECRGYLWAHVRAQRVPEEQQASVIRDFERKGIEIARDSGVDVVRTGASPIGEPRRPPTQPAPLPTANRQAWAQCAGNELRQRFPLDGPVRETAEEVAAKCRPFSVDPPDWDVDSVVAAISKIRARMGDSPAVVIDRQPIARDPLQF